MKIITPQKEFNFGKKEQLLSDNPQIRMREPNFKTYKNICLYKSLKFEEFVVVGCFKQIPQTKEIEVPAPPDRKIKKPEEIIENSETEKISGLEKPGFPTLKPIIPVSYCICLYLNA